MQSSDWLMPAVVLGMIASLLIAASLVRRYQQYKAHQRATLRRVASFVPVIEESLTQLASVPLARDLRVMLRGDVLRRLQSIRKVHARYPRIDERIREAQVRLDSEGPDTRGSVPPIKDERHFRQLLSAIDSVGDYLERGGVMGGMPATQRDSLLCQLRERRAEVMARFHIVQANRCQEQGDVRKAGQHLKILIEQLRSRGPNTDFVRELFLEAQQLQARLGHGGFAVDPVQEAPLKGQVDSVPLQQGG